MYKEALKTTRGEMVESEDCGSVLLMPCCGTKNVCSLYLCAPANTLPEAAVSVVLTEGPAPQLQQSKEEPSASSLQGNPWEETRHVPVLICEILARTRMAHCLLYVPPSPHLSTGLAVAGRRLLLFNGRTNTPEWLSQAWIDVADSSALLVPPMIASPDQRDTSPA